jgi:C4-dicarboxylate-specific signal transduction histidine kinase
VQPLDVDAALADMRRLLGRLAGPDVDLVIESESELPPVRFDASVLRHVVIDAVRAAAGAMPEGGRIAVRASAHTGGVELTVADTGPSASAIGLPGPYAPFHLAGGAAHAGLASVHDLAVSNGADVRIAPTPGGGSKLSLYLPAWT